MKYITKIFSMVMLLAVILAAAACGKVSEPRPIEGSGYPHSYPRR